MTIFEAVAKALESEAANVFLSKFADTKEIAASGIRNMTPTKPSELAASFYDQCQNSVETVKAFWGMMVNAVEYLQDHMWLGDSICPHSHGIQTKKKIRFQDPRIIKNYYCRCIPTEGSKGSCSKKTASLTFFDHQLALNSALAFTGEGAVPKRLFVSVKDLVGRVYFVGGLLLSGFLILSQSCFGRA